MIRRGRAVKAASLALCAVIGGGIIALASCAPKAPPSYPYVICNQMGNDAGCGDPVTINVE
jgi:hypothetical protein